MTPLIRTRRRLGFSLTELLVVIGIVVAIAALLFPAFDKARQSATTAPCMSHQKQIVSAMMAYAADNQGSLPHVGTSVGGAPETGMWFAVVSEYLNLPNGKYLGRHFLRCPAASKKRSDFSYGINYSTGGGLNDSIVFTRLTILPDGSPSSSYPGSKRLANLSPSTILIADTYDPLNPESSLFYHPASPNWSINTDKDGDGVNDSAASLGNRKFNCIDPRHANDSFIGVAADGSAKMLTIREWAKTPKYWGPSLEALRR